MPVDVHLLLFLRLGGWPGGWVWKMKLMLSQPNLAAVGVGAELGKSYELVVKSD